MSVWVEERTGHPPKGDEEAAKMVKSQASFFPTNDLIYLTGTTPTKEENRRPPQKVLFFSPTVSHVLRECARISQPPQRGSRQAQQSGVPRCATHRWWVGLGASQRAAIFPRRRRRPGFDRSGMNGGDGEFRICVGGCG